MRESDLALDTNLLLDGGLGPLGTTFLEKVRSIVVGLNLIDRRESTDGRTGV